MDKINSIKGYITSKGIDYPFLFENDVLFLFPQNIDMWQQMIADSITRINKVFISEDEKDIYFDLKGITDEGRDVLFRVDNHSSSINGFLQYQVSYYVVYNKKKLKLNSINGLIIFTQHQKCLNQK